MNLKLKVLKSEMAICRLANDADVPTWAQGEFVSITRTPDELSIVCDQERVPTELKSERGWIILRVEGKLDFSLTGILASITEPLAKEKISLFAISTFDTDYILVKNSKLELAISALRNSGIEVVT
jgi:uncharacterized protein